MVGNTGDGKVNREQVLGAVNEFCRSSNGYIEEEGENKWAIIREDKPIIHCGLEKGKFVCSDSDIGFVLLEIAKGIQEEENRKVERDQDLEQIKKTKTRAKQEIVKPQVTNVILEPVIDNKDLTLENIKQYICPLATDEEAFMFLKLCQARRLNPFVKEAYCIKYSKDQPASFVVGKDAFTRRAEEHPQFDGFEAGIIISTPQKENVNYLISSAFEERGGTFYSEGEKLLGGWAKVYRKDRGQPFKSTVSINEYKKESKSGKTPWDTMPATMIRKVALVSALREAFPSEFSGMYDQAEMGVEV